MSQTNGKCLTECTCAGCQCPRCGSAEFKPMPREDVVMEEILKPLFDFYLCTKCPHDWIVYK